jgi:hypothetical protein
MKILIGIAFVLLTVAAPNAGAQDSPQHIVGGMRSTCLQMVEDDMNADIAGAAEKRQSATQICDCAEARMADDPVVKKIASLPKEARRNMPKRDQVSIYITVKFYSASLACYADAVGKTADEVLAR